MWWLFILIAIGPGQVEVQAIKTGSWLECEHLREAVTRHQTVGRCELRKDA